MCSLLNPSLFVYKRDPSEPPFPLLSCLILDLLISPRNWVLLSGRDPVMGFCSLAVWSVLIAKDQRETAQYSRGLRRWRDRTMTDGNSKRSKVGSLIMVEFNALTKLWSFPLFLLSQISLSSILTLLSSFGMMKFSWSKKMVRKLFNIKSKAEDFQADEVVYAGDWLNFHRNLCLNFSVSMVVTSKHDRKGIRLVMPNQPLRVWFPEQANQILQSF